MSGTSHVCDKILQNVHRVLRICYNRLCTQCRCYRYRNCLLCYVRSVLFRHSWTHMLISCSGYTCVVPFSAHRRITQPSKYRGLQLLTSVIIADITTLKWRGLVSGMTSAPFLVNAVVGSKVRWVVLDHKSLTLHVHTASVSVNTTALGLSHFGITRTSAIFLFQWCSFMTNPCKGHSRVGYSST